MRGVLRQQEGIGQTLHGHIRRNGRACLRPFLLDMTEPAGDFLVPGEGVGGEAGIRQRIFVSAIEPGIVGQACQPSQRMMHLLRAALEQPAAAHGKQSVTDKDSFGVFEIISDVAGGMRRDFPDLRLPGADPDPVAFADEVVRLVDPPSLPPGR